MKARALARFSRSKVHGGLQLRIEIPRNVMLIKASLHSCDIAMGQGVFCTSGGQVAGGGQVMGSGQVGHVTG